VVRLGCAGVPPTGTPLEAKPSEQSSKWRERQRELAPELEGYFALFGAPGVGAVTSNSPLESPFGMRPHVSSPLAAFAG